MTNIDTMPAGPEMDALIAEKVMGWKRGQPYEDADYEVWGVDAVDDEGEQYFHLGAYIEDDYDVNGFHPSTDIAAAWRVVEYLDEINFVLSFLDHLGYDTDKGLNGMPIEMWRAEFMDKSGNDADRPHDEIWFGVEQAETAPLAICRAALKVVQSRPGIPHG